MAKRPQMGARPQSPDPEKWVRDRAVPPEARPAKRITLEVSDELHRKIKQAAAGDGQTIKQQITRILEEHYR